MLAGAEVCFDVFIFLFFFYYSFVRLFKLKQKSVCAFFYMAFFYYIPCHMSDFITCLIVRSLNFFNCHFLYFRCVLFNFIIFHCCLIQVRGFVSEDAQLNTEGHAAVLEIARMLLEAGAEKDESTSIRSLFVLLHHTRNSLQHMTSTLVVSKYFELIVELVKLFRKHGLYYERQYTLNVLIGAMHQIESFDQMAGMSAGLWDPLDLMNAVMNGFGALFRCFNMVGAAMVNVDTLPQVIVRTISIIAGYSCRSGHSDRLLLLILNVLSVNQVSTLKELLLSKHLEDNPDWISNDIRAYITNELERIGGVEQPPRLQLLACSAIRRTLCDRDLPIATDLGIPKHLMKSLEF